MAIEESSDPRAPAPAPPDATGELLAALDELYPLPDDDRRAERAGRTAFAVKRWMARSYETLQAVIPQLVEELAKSALAPAPPTLESIVAAFLALPSGDQGAALERMQDAIAENWE